jgi:hypothetical protein
VPSLSASKSLFSGSSGSSGGLGASTSSPNGRTYASGRPSSDGFGYGSSPSLNDKSLKNIILTWHLAGILVSLYSRLSFACALNSRTGSLIFYANVSLRAFNTLSVVYFLNPREPFFNLPESSTFAGIFKTCTAQYLNSSSFDLASFVAKPYLSSHFITSLDVPTFALGCIDSFVLDAPMSTSLFLNALEMFSIFFASSSASFRDSLLSLSSFYPL